MTDVRTFELVEGASAKFWEISQDGLDVEVRYGRIGTAGQRKVKTFADAGGAASHAIKLIGEKTRKGYAETTPGSAEAKPAEAKPTEAEPVAADEDVFVVPPAWRRFRLPRRGSGTSDPAGAAGEEQVLRVGPPRRVHPDQAVPGHPDAADQHAVGARVHPGLGRRVPPRHFGRRFGAQDAVQALQIGR